MASRYTSQLQQARRGRTNAPFPAQPHPGLKGTSPGPRMYLHQVRSVRGNSPRRGVEGHSTTANTHQGDEGIGLSLSDIDGMVSGEVRMQRQDEEQAPPSPPYRTPYTTAATGAYGPTYQTAATGSGDMGVPVRREMSVDEMLTIALRTFIPGISPLSDLAGYGGQTVTTGDEQSRRLEREWYERDRVMGRPPGQTQLIVINGLFKRKFAQMAWKREMEERRARRTNPEPEMADDLESGDGLVTWPRRRGSSSVQTVYHIDDKLPASAKR